MEKKNTSVFYNGLVWGLILGFASIIYSVILYMMGQYNNQWLGIAGFLITIVILVLGYRSFRDQVRDGVMPFGTAFGFGIVAILVSGLLGSIYTYVMMAMIDPDLLTQMMDIQMEKAMQRGSATEAQLEQGFEMMSWMFTPVMLSVMGFISMGFIGTIIALIMGAIFKRDEDPNAGLLEAEKISEETGASQGTEVSQGTEDTT